MKALFVAYARQKIIQAYTFFSEIHDPDLRCWKNLLIEIVAPSTTSVKGKKDRVKVASGRFELVSDACS